jgi:hypothetical protein
MELSCPFLSEMSIFGRPHRPRLLRFLSCANVGPAINATATNSTTTAIIGVHRFSFILLSFHKVAKGLTSVVRLEGYPLGRLGELSCEPCTGPA